MATPTRIGSHRSIEMLIACCTVMGLLFVAACSSDSDSSRDGAATTIQAGGGAADDGSSSNGELPDGFPDIPVPDFEKADVVKSGTETSPGWSVLLTVDPSLETNGDQIITAYAEQLEAAGYEIEGDTTDVSIQATKDGTDVTFHSSMDGTITIGVFDS